MRRSSGTGWSLHSLYLLGSCILTFCPSSGANKCSAQPNCSSCCSHAGIMLNQHGTPFKGGGNQTEKKLSDSINPWSSPACSGPVPPLQTGEQAAELLQVSPAIKKLYGNIRISFTKRLLQLQGGGLQPLSGLQFLIFLGYFVFRSPQHLFL